MGCPVFGERQVTSSELNVLSFECFWGLINADVYKESHFRFSVSILDLGLTDLGPADLRLTV